MTSVYLFLYNTDIWFMGYRLFFALKLGNREKVRFRLYHPMHHDKRNKNKSVNNL